MSSAILVFAGLAALGIRPKTTAGELEPRNTGSAP